jgi:hypothetical protein
VPRSGFRSVEALIDESKRLHDNISEWRSKLKQGMSPYFNPEQLDEYLDSRIHDLNFRLCNINKELGVSK